LKYLKLHENPWRWFMTNELECPNCEADIPLEKDDQSGDLVMCSYCKMTFKLFRAKDKWILSEDFEE
jgi:hypothetical protein